jgi:lauroyl/myristoyl acyltransferase
MPHLQRTEAGPIVFTAAGDAIEVIDTTVIRVFYFFAQFFKTGQWLIVRPGTSAVMLTTDSGLHALKMFRRGATLEAAKRELGKAATLEANRVNLAPLIEAAAKAGIVKSVNGVPARAPATDVRRLWMHLLKITVYPQLYGLIDLCPVGIRERLLFQLQWFFEGRFRCEMDRAKTEHNLQLLFPALPAATVRATALEYHRQKTRNNLAFITTGKGVKRVFRWLDVFLEKDARGEERFRECLARGRGVILVSFHFGCYWMMPALLLKMGLRVHVVIGSVSEREKAIERAVVPNHARARLKFYGPSVRGFLDLVAALREGDVVLIYADTHGLGQQAVQQFTHQTWGKAALARANATVLGHPFPVEATVGWLHRNDGAPIIPAVIYPVAGSWKVRLEFGKPLGLTGASHQAPALPLSDQAVANGVYSQLENWLVRLPEQWSYLSDFPTRRQEPPASV